MINAIPTSSESFPEGPSIFIGIDYALAAPHSICVRIEGQPIGVPFDIAADRKPLRNFFDKLIAKHPETRIRVCFESSGRQIHEMLETIKGVDLYPINPVASSFVRRALHLSGSKSDAIDSAALCDFLSRNHDRLEPAKPRDPLSVALSILCEDRRHLVGQRTKATNSMINAVRHDAPGLALAFKSFCKMYARLLVKWPDLAALRRARRSTIEKDLRRWGRLGKEKLQDVLDAIADLDPNATGTRWKFAVAQARLALRLMDEIKEYDLEIKDLYKTHPLKPILSSFPGVGAALGPRLCSFLSKGIETWSNPQQIACASGVAPISKTSGKSKKVVLRRYACRKFDLQTFVEMAGQSKRRCEWAKAFFDHKMANGKTTHVIYRALAFKWIQIIHACLKTNSKYDESKIRSPYKTAPKTTATPVNNSPIPV